MECPRCQRWAHERAVADYLTCCNKCAVGVPRLFACPGCDLTVTDRDAARLCLRCSSVWVCEKCVSCYSCQGFKRTEKLEQALQEFMELRTEQAKLKHVPQRITSGDAEDEDDLYEPKEPEDPDDFNVASALQFECQERMRFLISYIPGDLLIKLVEHDA